MKKCLMLIAFASVLLSACSSDIEVSVEFSERQMLTAGDPVKFNGQIIGEVADVDDAGEGTAVALHLDEDKLAGLNTSAAAMVVNQDGRYLALYAPGTGEPVESGAAFEGLNNPVDLATWTAGNAMGALQGMATSAANAFNEFLKQNNWDDVARQLNESLSELNEDSTGALNQLGSDLEAFIRNMQDQSAESLKQADQLSRQLHEEFQKFQQQGAQGMARALQNMLDAFNSALDSRTIPDKGEPL